MGRDGEGGRGRGNGENPKIVTHFSRLTAESANQRADERRHCCQPTQTTRQPMGGCREKCGERERKAEGGKKKCTFEKEQTDRMGKGENDEEGKKLGKYGGRGGAAPQGKCSFAAGG